MVDRGFGKDAFRVQRVDHDARAKRTIYDVILYGFQQRAGEKS